MNGHGETDWPHRVLTDAEIWAMTASERKDLMAECDYEPALPESCDACAAYVIQILVEEGQAYPGPGVPWWEETGAR